MNLRKDHSHAMFCFQHANIKLQIDFSSSATLTVDVLYHSHDTFYRTDFGETFPDFSIFLEDSVIFEDLTVVNVLARVVMKNVANCDMQYELRNFVNY